MLAGSGKRTIKVIKDRRQKLEREITTCIKRVGRQPMDADLYADVAARMAEAEAFPHEHASLEAKLGKLQVIFEDYHLKRTFAPALESECTRYCSAQLQTSVLTIATGWQRPCSALPWPVGHWPPSVCTLPIDSVMPVCVLCV